MSSSERTPLSSDFNSASLNKEKGKEIYYFIFITAVLDSIHRKHPTHPLILCYFPDLLSRNNTKNSRVAVMCFNQACMHLAPKKSPWENEY